MGICGVASLANPPVVLCGCKEEMNAIQILYLVLALN